MPKTSALETSLERVIDQKLEELRLRYHALLSNVNDEAEKLILTVKIVRDIEAKVESVTGKFDEKKKEEKRPRSNRVTHMPKEYFSRINVKNDLEAYAARADKKMSLFTHGIMMGITASCSNDEKIKGANYLGRAGVALGIAATREEIVGEKYQEIFDKLKQIAGI